MYWKRPCKSRVTSSDPDTVRGRRPGKVETLADWDDVRDSHTTVQFPTVVVEVPALLGAKVARVPTYCIRDVRQRSVHFLHRLKRNTTQYGSHVTDRGTYKSFFRPPSTLPRLLPQTPSKRRGQKGTVGKQSLLGVVDVRSRDLSTSGSVTVNGAPSRRGEGCRWDSRKGEFLTCST